MIRKLGWLAAGGFGVGIIAFGLVAALGAHELPWRQISSIWPLASACPGGEDVNVDPTVTERHWAWEGGDSVEIAVPGTVHYRGGRGDEVTVRGPAEALAHLRVHDGRINYTCGGRWGQRDLDITLPGRAFRAVTISGSGKLIMQDIDQPSLDLAISGSGSMRAQGASERVRISIAGAGNAKLAELTIKRLDVDIAGSGDIEAAPQEALNVDIAGSGNIRLLSDPAVVHTDIKGSGRVIRASSR